MIPKLFGKPRTKLGNYLDKHRINQSLLQQWTKGAVSQTMLSRMCSEKDYHPTTDKVNIILKALRKHVDSKVEYEDFFM